MGVSRSDQKRRMSISQAVFSVMTNEPQTCREIAERLNMPVHNVSSALVSLHCRGKIEKAGFVDVDYAKNARSRVKCPLWMLLSGEPKPVEPRPSHRAIIRPPLEYRNEFAPYMGEPPIGRSALDMRGMK